MEIFQLSIKADGRLVSHSDPGGRHIIISGGLEAVDDYSPSCGRGGRAWAMGSHKYAVNCVNTDDPLMK